MTDKRYEMEIDELITVYREYGNFMNELYNFITIKSIEYRFLRDGSIYEGIMSFNYQKPNKIT